MAEDFFFKLKSTQRIKEHTDLFVLGRASLTAVSDGRAVVVLMVLMAELQMHINNDPAGSWWLRPGITSPLHTIKPQLDIVFTANNTSAARTRPRMSTNVHETPKYFRRFFYTREKRLYSNCSCRRQHLGWTHEQPPAEIYLSCPTCPVLSCPA